MSLVSLTGLLQWESLCFCLLKAETVSVPPHRQYLAHIYILARCSWDKTFYFIHFHFFKVLCMCMFMYVLNVYMCTPVSRAKFNLQCCFSKSCPHFYLRQGLLLAWSLPSRGGWPAGEPRRSTCLHLSSTVALSLCHPAWQARGLWDQAQALRLAWQALYQPSYLFSLLLFLYNILRIPRFCDFYYIIPSIFTDCWVQFSRSDDVSS